MDKCQHIFTWSQLFVLIITLFCISRTCAELVPLYDAPEGKGIDGEFLVVAKGRFDDLSREEIRARIRTRLDELPAKIRAKLGQFAELLREKHDIASLREFALGTWRAVLVKINTTVLQKLREDIGDIDLIENNQMLQSRDTPQMYSKNLKTEVREVSYNPNFSPNTTTKKSEKCYQEVTTEALWGLARISYRTRPDYKSATYEYQALEDGRDVDIYVVDSGVNTGHDEFNDRAKHGYTAESLKEAEGDGDDNGHGTNVASIAAGLNVGVAKQANIIAVKVLNAEGAGYTSWTIEGLEWVYNQLKSQATGSSIPKAVINLSLGSDGRVPTMDAVIESLISQGIPVCIAAGNSNMDACTSSPGRVDEALTVGATTKDDELAEFSNWGRCVDILAPGAGILGAFKGGHDSMAMVSGTSQATPFVAGVVARYLGAHADDVTPEEVKHYILSTATSGVIHYPTYLPSRETPNLLLYTACDGSNEGHSAIFVSSANAIFSTIIAIITLSVCIALIIVSRH